MTGYSLTLSMLCAPLFSYMMPLINPNCIICKIRSPLLLSRAPPPLYWSNYQIFSSYPKPHITASHMIPDMTRPLCPADRPLRKTTKNPFLREKWKRSPDRCKSTPSGRQTLFKSPRYYSHVVLLPPWYQYPLLISTLNIVIKQESQHLTLSLNKRSIIWLYNKDLEKAFIIYLF